MERVQCTPDHATVSPTSQGWHIHLDGAGVSQELATPLSRTPREICGPELHLHREVLLCCSLPHNSCLAPDFRVSQISPWRSGVGISIPPPTLRSSRRPQTRAINPLSTCSFPCVGSQSASSSTRGTTWPHSTTRTYPSTSSMMAPRTRSRNLQHSTVLNVRHERLVLSVDVQERAEIVVELSDD